MAIYRNVNSAEAGAAKRNAVSLAITIDTELNYDRADPGRELSRFTSARILAARLTEVL
jgi:hypothetical protein